MNKTLSLIFAVIMGVFSYTPSALAGDEKQQGDWQFDLAPFYLWAVSLDGDVAIGPKGDSVTVDFGDIFDNLESAFIVHFETLYKQKYGFFFDVNFIDIGQSSSLAETDVDVNLKVTIAELAPYYRWTTGDHNFDAFAGILYSKVETDAVFSNSPRGINVSEDWVDPYLGARWNWLFADQWGTSVKGAIGGFGVSSDFVWEAAALLTWQPWKHAQFLAGYRAVGIDYETGSGQNRFVYDVTLSGPLLGINFRW